MPTFLIFGRKKSSILPPIWTFFFITAVVQLFWKNVMKIRDNRGSKIVINLWGKKSHSRISLISSPIFENFRSSLVTDFHHVFFQITRELMKKSVQIGRKIDDFFSTKNKKYQHKKCTLYWETPLALSTNLKLIYFFENHASLPNKPRALFD